MFRTVLAHALPFLIIATGFGFALESQEDRRRKPVLIRADQTEQGSAEKVYEHDPEKAKENVKIGDFYFRRDNLKAAADRYREAIQYNKGWSEPYEKLIRALEKDSEYAKAVAVCEEFLEHNADSSQARHFEAAIKRLKEKISG